MIGLYPGCVAPVKSVVVVETDDAAFDLSTATGGRIIVVFQNGAEVSWDAELSAEDEGTVTLTREHEADDVPTGTEGQAFMRAEVDIPASAAPLVTSAQAVPVRKVGV